MRMLSCSPKINCSGGGCWLILQGRMFNGTLKELLPANSSAAQGVDCGSNENVPHGQPTTRALLARALAAGLRKSLPYFH